MFLLIRALLDTETIQRYLTICESLGLAALVEAHDPDQIRSAVFAGAKIIGVNNRNLHDFSVDFSNAARLRDLIPPECIYVAESGVSAPSDIAQLSKIGADAALVGELLMRAEDKKKMLSEMRSFCPMTKIKTCGLFRERDIDYVNQYLPDYAGFVLNFPKSRRSLSPEKRQRT